MSFSKTLITAILIVAAAAQPVVAAIEPCCCLVKAVAPPVEAVMPPCCAAKTVEVAASLPACCARKQQVRSCALHDTNAGGANFDRAGCCCVKPAPALPNGPTNVAEQTISAAAFTPALGEATPLVPAPPLRRFEQAPGTLSPSGPPLLALLCVWRK